MLCGGKEKHTFERADKIARLMNRRHKGSVPLAAYKCKKCHEWHVGGDHVKKT